MARFMGMAHPPAYSDSELQAAGHRLVCHRFPGLVFMATGNVDRMPC